LLQAKVSVSPHKAGEMNFIITVIQGTVVTVAAVAARAVIIHG
jgi:hypothetical protein